MLFRGPAQMVLTCTALALAVNQSLAEQPNLLSEEPGLPVSPTFSPDGKLLATVRTVPADSDPALPAPEPGHSTVSKIVVWDVHNRQPVRTLGGQTGVNGHLSRCLVFSPDGRTLALAEANGRVRLWDTTAWQETTLTVPRSEPPKKTSRNTSYQPVCGELAFSADSRLLAVCYTGPANKGVVRVWEQATGTALAVLDTEGSPQHAKFLSDNRLWVVVLHVQAKQAYRELQHWSTESFTRLDRLKLSQEALHGRFSPDGAVFAAAQREQVVLYDCRTGRGTPGARYGDFRPPSAGATYRVGVSALAFSPNGQVLALGGDFDRHSTRVKLWNVSQSGRGASDRFLDPVLLSWGWNSRPTIVTWRPSSAAPQGPRYSYGT